MSDHKEAKSFLEIRLYYGSSRCCDRIGKYWKFPYLAYGERRTVAFVLVYIVICILLGTSDRSGGAGSWT